MESGSSLLGLVKCNQIARPSVKTKASWLFEIALMFVRFYHAARVIVNADHCIM
jgi:hypothetical protein